MTTTLQNSIWPNDDGNLGNIKVQIPDGVNVKWPEGDALLGNCVYQNGKLVGFVDTKALTVNSSGSTTINYDYVNIELPFAEDAMTINRGPRNKYLIIKFNDKEVEEGIVYVRFEELSEETKALLRSAHKVIDNILYDVDGNVIGEFDTRTIETASNIVDIYSEETIDGKPADALYVNYDQTGERGLIITEFSSNLSSLTDGKCMFTMCLNLETFSSDLSSLTDGSWMFHYCTNLTSFNSDLSNLTKGWLMFGSTNLSSFDSDLSNLTKGWAMFSHCTNLTSFKSDLSSLTYGYVMFSDCKLDTASVQNIADTIKDVNGLTNSEPDIYTGISIGIGNSTPNDQEIDAFNTISSKGWTVLVNGSKYTPTSPAAITTLDENGEEIITPLPYYAKSVPATEETASYIDTNGNYYNIVGAQFIYGDDISTYGMFTCEADAAANMRLTKIEKSQRFALKP